MMRVALYVRLSDEDEIKKNNESESIINQRMLLIDYANNQGWKIEGIYVDEDYSGADINKNRPSFEKLIKDAENSKFDIVLCKTQSRFTRDMEVLEKYVHNKFIQWGIRFVTVVDRVDTLDKANKKSRQINGLVNEWYLEDLSNDIKNTLKKKMEKGQFIGSWAPYGYKKSCEDNHKLVVDEYAANVVRMIFRLYKDGYGVRKIVSILNEKGYDKPSVYMRKNGEKFPIKSKNEFWSDYTVYRILRNNVYIGVLTQGKLTTLSYKNSKLIKKNENDWVVIKNNHEPIIDENSFNLVQELLSKKRRTSKYLANENTKKNSSDKYTKNEGLSQLFFDKVKCKMCGGNMVKTTIDNGTGKKYSYLRCKNHTVYGDKVCKYCNRINYDKLVKIIENELKILYSKYAYDKSFIENVAEKIKTVDYENIIQKLNNNIDNLNIDLENKKRALANLYIDKINTNIDEIKYMTISLIIESDIKSLNEKIQLFKAQIEEINSKKKQSNYHNIILDKIKLSDGLNYQLVQNAIGYIDIEAKNSCGKRKIYIHWNL